MQAGSGGLMKKNILNEKKKSQVTKINIRKQHRSAMHLK